jgi:two-component system, OmpR family, sensor histidine kinase TctE
VSTTPSLAGRSLRRTLLVGLLVPVLLLVAVNTVSLYREALAAANIAYDRTLLASAKTIGEQLTVSGYGAQARLSATVPYSALEAFESDNQSRMYYKVTGPDGAVVSGFADLPPWSGTLPVRPAYAALVDFYDDTYRDHAVRVAALEQPVVSTDGSAMALIQVAETLELREARAGEILVRTLWRQGLLVIVIALVVVWVVQRATAPVRALSSELRARAVNDLRPVDSAHAPRELRPILKATNQVMGRLAHLLKHQKRFVRDTAHQLRTPLAVLKAQVQSARRGDVDAMTALAEIEHTVDRATQLANQMLSLAKVEQLMQEDALIQLEWSACVREVALDLAPLVADKSLDFDLSVEPAQVTAHDWMLSELTRNLLHNAIKHCPRGGTLSVRLGVQAQHAVLQITDSGLGLSEDQREHLFEAFAASGGQGGAGLGLAICHGITQALGGELALSNRVVDGRVRGLVAEVVLPLAA